MSTHPGSDPENRDPDPLPPIEPVFSTSEREDLRCLAYHVGELEKLRDRGLLSVDALNTVKADTGARHEQIQRSGQARAQIAMARRLASRDVAAALRWADAARQLDPTQVEGWALAVELHIKRNEDAAAANLYGDALRQFPGFTIPPAQLARVKAFRAGASAGPALADDDPLAQARSAIQRRDPVLAALLAAQVLQDQPEHFDAHAVLALALVRAERFQDALPHYEWLQAAQPENDVWTQWVNHVREQAEKPKPVAPVVREAGVTAAQAVPALSWSGVAGEFLQDHWQKLILCLAVLLIVVRSNVGAAQLLGPKLWSPVGKCVLSLVYTAMFAGFGAGLARWGAERSGRIMLLTTLLVVPADFMLAGQMKLLTEPDLWKLTVLGVDIVTLFLLIRLVVFSLGLKHGRHFLSAALFALSVFNVAASPGLSLPWGWQFTVFLAPAFIFLGAVMWVNTRCQEGDVADRRESTYFALAIFTFAFLTGVARTGAFVLELVPALYAIPLMIAAIACVHTGRRLGRFDPESPHEAWLRFGGLVVSALAIALALARPPVVLPLYSGNTLAVAVLALVLYAALLVQERQPAYLYLAFGALFLSYFGAHYFIRDLLQVIEEVVKRLVNHQGKLPLPFKAINGLVFNLVLAVLSILFTRRWRDARLARHCHLIGVPFSMAACILSAFHPKAAVICLSGYTVLYVAAVIVFRVPRILYLATAALAGAVYFGSTFVPGITVATQALAGAVLALGYWLVATVIQARMADRSYALPIARSALALATIAMVAALLSVLPAQPVFTPGFSAAAALLVGSLVVVLVNREEPRATVVAWAIAGLNLAYVYAVLAARDRWIGVHDLSRYGIAAGAAALVLAWAGVWLSRRVRRGSAASDWRLYLVPLFSAAFVQVGLAVLICGIHTARVQFVHLTPAEFATMAVALALSAATFTVLSQPFRRVELAHLALACSLGVWACLFRAGLLPVRLGFSGPDVVSPFAMLPPDVLRFGEHGAVVSVFALVLLGFLELTRLLSPKVRIGDPEFQPSSTSTLDLFSKALPDALVAVVLVSVGLAIYGLSNGPLVIFTLGAGAVAVLGSTRVRRPAWIGDLGLWLAVFAAWCQTDWMAPAVAWVAPGTLLSWLAVTTAGMAVVLWAVARFEWIGQSLGIDLSAGFRTARVLTWLAPVAAIIGRTAAIDTSWICTIALVTNVLALVLLTTSWRKPSFTYRAVISAALAVYVVVFSIPTTRTDTAHIPGLVAVSIALALSALGFACRAWSRSDVRGHWEELYCRPLFRSALVLTVLGALASYWSPISMGLAALAFLLLVKGIPSREWLYATVSATACAFYFAWLQTVAQTQGDCTISHVPNSTFSR